jgi:hypothetical protein
MVALMFDFFYGALIESSVSGIVPSPWRWGISYALEELHIPFFRYFIPFIQLIAAQGKKSTRCNSGVPWEEEYPCF